MLNSAEYSTSFNSFIHKAKPRKQKGGEENRLERKRWKVVKYFTTFASEDSVETVEHSEIKIICCLYVCQSVKRGCISFR